jgi:predicted metal-dependent phosphoesterase TrpH
MTASLIRADLHTHTNCSDGQLTPDQLLAEAAEKGVQLFSITDHDTLAAYRQLTILPPEGMKLLVGIELSCTWRRMTIHMIGLNLDAEAASMLEAETKQGQARAQRYEKILQRLTKAGLDIDTERLITLGGSCPGRPHIARYLYETGQVKSETQAFDKYLGQGKMGDVKECWPDLSQAIDWVQQAGGVAVLAHPIKYRLTRTKLIELCTDFKEAGGEGMEIISGQQNPTQTKTLSEIAQKLELLGSVGSDFHKPGQPWAVVGKVAALSPGVTPIWTLFD